MLNLFQTTTILKAPNVLTDDELMLLLRQGDVAAFTYLYDHYWDKLYYVAHRMLKDSHASEEVVQEVFIALWKKKETLRIESINPYLAAMTRYAVYRSLARQKVSKDKEDQVGRLNASAIAEVDVDNKILLEIITTLSNKLPEKCRLVFQYNKLQDRPLAEVAEQLGMSQKTAEAHLTKALRTIRATMNSAKTDYMQIVILMAILKK